MQYTPGKFEISRRESICLLRVKNAKPEDEGKYSCEVEGDTTVCELKVDGTYAQYIIYLCGVEGTYARYVMYPCEVDGEMIVCEFKVNCTCARYVMYSYTTDCDTTVCQQ